MEHSEQETKAPQQKLQARARTSRDAETYAARSAQQLQADSEPMNLSDAVWATLEVISPDGVERATLEETAANVGISLDALLAEDTQPALESTSAATGTEAPIGTVPASPGGAMSCGNPPAGDAPFAGEESETAEEDGTVASELSKLALLSTAPHTEHRAARFGVSA